jgi:dihydrofolate reductase
MKKNISIIAAMANNRVIGFENQMPWHLPADLKHFKALTLGKPIVMGRKTYESLGRPLPNRRNIVLSRQSDLMIPGVDVFADLPSVLTELEQEAEIMIIGGAILYQEALALAQQLYLTQIDLDVRGDAFFPLWKETEWRLIKEQKCLPDLNNPYSYRFQHWVR